MGLIPNPWILLAFAIALGGTAIISYEEGHSNGKAAQKVEDQGDFDRINKMLAANKASANRLYQAKQAENIAIMSERDALKTKLETERQANEKKNRDLRTEYADLKLRFTVPSDGRDRNGGGQPGPAASGAASAASPEIVVELPDAIARDLRQLTYDADQLRTAYAVCYGYATEVR